MYCHRMRRRVARVRSAMAYCGDASGPDRLAVGQLRRQRSLHSDAVYRVCAWTEAFVEVEVVIAPGLEASQSFRFTRAAVLAMDVVPADEGPFGPTEPRG